MFFTFFICCTVILQFDGLADMLEKHPKARAIVLTDGPEGKNGRIELMPLWKWLLGI